MEILKAYRIHEAGHWLWWLPWAPRGEVDGCLCSKDQDSPEALPSLQQVQARIKAVQLGSVHLSCVLLCNQLNALSLSCCEIKSISFFLINFI